MDDRRHHEDRERWSTAPAPRAAHGTAVLETQDPQARDTHATDPVTDPLLDGMTGIAVFPRPLTTLASGAIGALIGFVCIYLIVALRLEPLVGAGVLVVLFALALSGPKLLADAESDAGRAVALILNGLAFGGTLGGLVVLMAF